MTEPKIEAGVVVGNTYDKYGSKNPLARFLVRRFLSSFDRLVGRTGAHRVLEVGCGEGELSLCLARQGREVVGTDISERMVELARNRAREEGLPAQFEVANVFDLDPGPNDFDLVVCCEVLEHLVDPGAALTRLVRIAAPHLLLSVPREPLWRILNLTRLSYVRDLGNTPGHLQHWTRGAFVDFVGRHATIMAEDSPLPWTMLLARCR